MSPAPATHLSRQLRWSSPRMPIAQRGSLLIVLRVGEVIEDDDWSALLNLMRNEPGLTEVLVQVDGHSRPNAAQRAKLVETLRDRPLRLAVLTSSVPARLTLQTLTWAGLTTAAGFAPHDLGPALQFLENGLPATLVREDLAALAAGVQSGSAQAV